MADGSSGEDRVVATAHHILRTLSSSHTDDMLRILSTFDDRFSRFSLSLPRAGSAGSPSSPAARSDPGLDGLHRDHHASPLRAAAAGRGNGNCNGYGDGVNIEREEEGPDEAVDEGDQSHPVLRSAQETIMRWDFGSSELARQTFLWSDQRDLVPEYLDAVDNVQSLIDTLSLSSSSSSSERLSSSSALDCAHNVLQFAMLRLEAEFSQILEQHSLPADPEGLSSLMSSRSSFNAISVSSSSRTGEEDIITHDEEDDEEDGEAIARSRSISDMTIDLLSVNIVADLCDIATRMVRSGYQAECSQVYIGIRKSTLEESLQKLGHERLTFEEVQRMPWQVLENEIAKWIQVMKIAIHCLFPCEKQLCHKMFAEASESFFTDIAKPSLMHLLNFAEAVAIGRRASEKLFKILDMYEALRDMLPAIESLFEEATCASLRSEIGGILSRLGDAARGTFTEFEHAIQRETSKTPMPGGAVHPMAKYVLNYLRFMSDYTETLNQLLWDRRVIDVERIDQGGSSGGHSEAGPLSSVTTTLMEMLERSLDAKSKLYKDPALACLFLMNNTHYIGQKVKDSGVRKLLGDEWIKRNNGKLRQYHNNYRRTAWMKVLSYMTDEGINISGGSASGASRNVLKERFKNFNAAFEENVKTQSSWIVSDAQLSTELRISITGMILPAYRSFLGRFQNHLDVVRHPEKYVKYSPEDLEAYLLNDLFEGSSASMNRRKPSSGAGSVQ